MAERPERGQHGMDGAAGAPPRSETELLAILRTGSPPPASSVAVPPSLRGGGSIARGANRLSGRSAFATALLVMAAALVAAAIGGLMLGSVPIPADTAIRILLHAATGDWLIAPDWRAAYETIVIETRLPRVLLAAIVGGTLAVTGMTIQAIVRNPLASPSILGISWGAATGAVIVMRWGLLFFGAFTLHIAAFAGALVTLVAVFAIARSGGHMTPTRLILAGVAMAAILNALTALLVLTSPDPQLASRVLFWTLGSFGNAQWRLLPIPAAALALGLAAMLLQARRLNLLMAGEESAASLGLDVQRFRQTMFVLAAALIGVVVAAAGVIAFVGLIVPHIVRFIVGADHRRALPAAAIGGAAFVIAADLVARKIIAPLELPIGIITALVGGPFFVWLLRRDGRAEARS